MSHSPDTLLRSWARRRDAYVSEPAGYRYPDNEGDTHELAFDNGYRDIKVWFTTVVGLDGVDVVRVRSQNWRCENEPSGFMTREIARKLYAECLMAGMTKGKS